MTKTQLLFFCRFALFIGAIGGCNTPTRNMISVEIPTVEKEAEYVWSTIQDLPFYQKHGYQLSLPKGAYMDSLKAKANRSELQPEDLQALNNWMRDTIYRASDYEKGFEKVSGDIDRLNAMIGQLASKQFPWGFHIPEVYDVELTLYGPGGSYNPENGVVLIYTTPAGNFKQHEGAVNTLIHEIVHIGIETSIIQKYNVPHALKERIVDQMVSLMFRGELEGYMIQDMGDHRIDQYLKSQEDLKKLDEYVAEIMGAPQKGEQP